MKKNFLTGFLFSFFIFTNVVFAKAENSIVVDDEMSDKSLLYLFVRVIIIFLPVFFISYFIYKKAIIVKADHKILIKKLFIIYLIVLVLLTLMFADSYYGFPDWIGELFSNY